MGKINNYAIGTLNPGDKILASDAETGATKNVTPQEIIASNPGCPLLIVCVNVKVNAFPDPLTPAISNCIVPTFTLSIAIIFEMEAFFYKIEAFNFRFNSSSEIRAI
jgi:hypothetical protein